MADQPVNGERFRALTIVDVFCRETLAIEIGKKLRGEVVGVFNRLVVHRRTLKLVFVDNGSEVLGADVGSLGVSSRSSDRLQPAREADGQLLHRDVQRITSGRMSERRLVLVEIGGEIEDRSLAERLQRESSSPGSRGADASRVCQRGKGLETIRGISNRRNLTLWVDRKGRSTQSG